MRLVLGLPLGGRTLTPNEMPGISFRAGERSAMTRFQHRLFASLAVAAGFAVVYSLWRTPDRDQIVREVDGVTEIGLEFDPTAADGVRGPVMGLGYALWVNFARVIHQGESFDQVGSGATLIRRHAQPTRFVVREGYRLKRGPLGTLRYATLTVEDRQAQAIVATKEWRCDERECRVSADGEEGWPGQRAALFVRKALNPAMPIGGAPGIKPYPRTVASVEHASPTTASTHAALTSSTFGCPQDLSVYVRQDINRMVVARTDWIFVAPHMTRQVRCTADGIFVFSTTFPEDIFVDWLSPQGELRGQYHVKPGVEFPSSDGGTFPFFAGVDLHSGTLELRMTYFHKRWPTKGDGATMPQWELLARVSVDQSAQLHSRKPVTERTVASLPR